VTGAAEQVSARVARLRSQGDAHASQGRAEEAHVSWRKALGLVEAWVDDPLADESHNPAEQANFLGIRGGLERRLGEVGRALDSYRRGALIESAADLPATYNRVNAVKLALIADDRTVSDIHHELVELREALQRRFERDDSAKDDAWLWADLGDVQLLLGEEAEAAAAYRTFADKAQSTSPESTLRVIKEVAAALRVNGDSAAGRIGRSVVDMQRVLTT
jgi:predicted negative regulator of RcsB-dependent stress response